MLMGPKRVVVELVAMRRSEALLRLTRFTSVHVIATQELGPETGNVQQLHI